MAKRKRSIGKQNQKRKVELRGTGNFDKYKPWISIQDVGSTGLSTRIKGIKTGRIHHFLSLLELNYFYLLDWSDDVIDIREQYPLDNSETLALAKEVHIIHPPLSYSDKSFVMTTDFLITVKQIISTKEFARTVKYSKDLSNKRVLEKLEIERLYWNERNTDWGIVTELDINGILVQNLKWLYPYRDIKSLSFPNTSTFISELNNYLLSFVIKKDSPLRIIANSCDKKFGFNNGESLSLIRYLIATKKWSVDMLKPIRPEEILNFISASDEDNNL